MAEIASFNYDSSKIVPHEDFGEETYASKGKIRRVFSKAYENNGSDEETKQHKSELRFGIITREDSGYEDRVCIELTECEFEEVLNAYGVLSSEELMEKPVMIVYRAKDSLWPCGLIPLTA